MMRIGLLKGSFDPISEETIRYARELVKKEHLSCLCLFAEGEGILDIETRNRLIRKAVKPYRHLACGMVEEPDYCETRTDETEAEIRRGSFRKAAKGTRKVLITEGYYLEQVVDALCKPRRAAHSRSVASVCAELAGMHHLDVKKAWIMGMLHDVTKRWSDEEGKPVMEIYYPDMLSYSPKVWHSYTAPVFCYQEMGLRDRTIRHALECHTIGNGRGAYDHILYIADKCEPLRGYDVSYQMTLAAKNLSAAAEYVLNESRQYILETEGIHV